mgnify:CR=1 FL=1
MRVDLQSAGHVVVLAAGGLEGVARARSLGPAVIVMDYYMTGLSSTEPLKQIRADPDIAKTPVLALPAWSSDASRLEAENLGAAWLEKSLSGEALIDAVGRMIAS